MIQLVLILEIFGLQVDFNGCRSKSWSLRWHQAVLVSLKLAGLG